MAMSTPPGLIAAAGAVGMAEKVGAAWPWGWRRDGLLAGRQHDCQQRQDR